MSQRSLCLAVIIVHLFVVAFLAHRLQKCSKSPRHHAVPCHAVPCHAVPCHAAPSTAAEAALTVSANAIYNDANAIVGTLSSWLPQVYSAAGMTADEISSDQVYQSVLAFMNNNAQIGLQDNPTSAAQSLATAVALLQNILANTLNASPKALAALAAADDNGSATGYHTVLGAITNDLSTVQSAINAYNK